ncbi:MAG: hypothetical protein ACI9VT_003059 [Psychroserpens sp.]|jgi:hypothetical protein
MLVVPVLGKPMIKSLFMMSHVKGTLKKIIITKSICHAALCLISKCHAGRNS